MKRRLAYILACSLLCAQVPQTAFAMTKGDAQLGVTLNLDYPVSDYDNVALTAQLLSEAGDVVATLPISDMELIEEEGKIVFENLPVGTYQVQLKGKGYKTYTSEAIELVKTSKHLVVNAGSDTFTLGDINADGEIDELDLSQLEEKLGTNDLNHDLNGDEKVDIEDLSQLYWSQDTVGRTELYNTILILSSMLDEKEVETAIQDINEGRVEVEGEIASLFDGNDATTVVLNSEAPITEGTPIKIPITFNEEVKVSQIEISAPLEEAPTAGYVVYEDENGKTVRQSFTSSETYQMKHTRNAGKVIKINLGKQVPIQKLTIEVTATNDSSGLLAAISKIEFLENVVDHAINQEEGNIKGFKGYGINEGVSLSWNQAANITGYKVQYGTKPGQYEETRYTDTNSIVIEGLENFKPYYFIVQAINGDWEGKESDEITVIPAPNTKPAVPTEVQVAGFDKALKVNFRLGKDASSANVYYKKASERNYSVIENVNKSTVIKNLENDTEYMVYVTAVNSAGESTPSVVRRGTPTAETIVIPEVPTVNRMSTDHIKEISLLDSYNVDQKFYPEGFEINNIIDGDYNTHWTAQTYQRSRGFNVTFDQPYEMDYVAFVPRLDSDLDRYEGTRKYWEYPFLYSIKVWETLDSEPKTLVNRAKIPSVGKDGLKILPFEKTTVEKMEVSIYEWDGAGATSISEVMFYEHNDMIERIDEIFADGMYIELKSGVTVDDIDGLITELDALEGAVLWTDKAILREELVAAREMLTTGQMSNLGEVVEVVQTRQLSSAQSQNFAADGLSNLQATGVMAYAGDQIIVYVDAPQGGNMPELVVSQFFGDETWSKSIPLKQGRNVISVPEIVHYNIEKGGALYLTYTGKEQDPTKVRIVNAKKIPTLELENLNDERVAKTEIRTYVEVLNDYVNSLDLSNKTVNPANITEIGTDKVLLSLPAEEVYRGLTQGLVGDIDGQVERLYESLMTWEDNMCLHYNVLGLEPDAAEEMHRYPKTRMNIRYMPMNNDVFMYAAGNHIGIRYDSGAGLVQGERDAQTGYFGWGINHEVGHIINDENFVVSETSNNIFSLFAQTVNGGPSRLESSNVYDKIYKKVVSKDTGFSSDVFVNLGMFWQLHLAYDDHNRGVKPDDFYPTLHRLSREANMKGLDIQNYIVRLASDVAQRDLTPFFERWGLHISEETYDYTAQYQAEERALYYLNDEAMRYRLDGGQGMAQDAIAEITADVNEGLSASDKEVRLSLTSSMNPEDLLGYEIYRDGELVAFTTEDHYTDKIAENNVTHTYSVVAYDKLLNQTDEAFSDEVYIASEGVIDTSEYSIERTTLGSLQIVLPAAPEVVGLKFKDITTQAGTRFEVEISEDGENWTSAKRGKFEADTSMIYFNKPGASDDDDRIWTYDARYIRLSGQGIEDLSDEQIDVIAYPGDAVYFIDNAIGYLAEDYLFEDGMIEQGTLVVMGSYRGHPVYSKIVLSAEYVGDKAFDDSERPGYDHTDTIESVAGDLYMFAEVPEDGEVSKVGNGIWMFVPEAQTLPAQIKANMFRTDEATSVAGGRLVSDTKWLMVPAAEDMPTIELD